MKQIHEMDYVRNDRCICFVGLLTRIPKCVRTHTHTHAPIHTPTNPPPRSVSYALSLTVTIIPITTMAFTIINFHTPTDVITKKHPSRFF